MVRPTQAEHIIARFGSATKLAKAIGKPHNTVWSWKDRGFIPTRWHKTVLDAAREAGVELGPQDFFEWAA